jgi:hypothetical protein
MKIKILYENRGIENKDKFKSLPEKTILLIGLKS